MKVIVLYRENSEYGTEIKDYIRDFEKKTGKTIEELDPDTISGENFAEVHGIVEYPTMVAVSDDGRTLEEWRGKPLPRMDEVSYFAEEKQE